MGSIVLRNEEDVLRLLTGLGIMGTGGGGSIEVGKRLLIKDIEIGPLEIKDIETISDNQIIAVLYRMGSMAPMTTEKRLLEDKLGLRRVYLGEKFSMLALFLLERFLNIDVDVLAPLELGGSNTPTPLSIAHSTGKIFVDGDFAQRAIPEITQTTLCMRKISPTPAGVADRYGNTTIITKAISCEMAERIGKMLSVASLGTVAIAGFLMNGKQLKETIIPGTVSKAYEVGKVVREAVSSGDDPAKRLIEKVEGSYILFKGKIIDVNWRDDPEGYMIGMVYIKGSEEFKDDQMKIWFKNENHISWLNDKPYVTSPDLISLIDLRGNPVTNDTLSIGINVYVIGFKAHKIFRTEEGIKILGPKHFGFDIEYKPIEELTSSPP
ncbi:MAG: DUF917 domain-containing protein [Sulfolobales archaeon]